MKTIRLAAALSLAITVAALATDAASASSIVFTKGGDLWRSSPVAEDGVGREADAARDDDRPSYRPR